MVEVKVLVETKKVFFPEDTVTICRNVLLEAADMKTDRSVNNIEVINMNI